MKCRLCQKVVREEDPKITEPDDKGNHTYVHMTCYAAEKARVLLERQASQNTPKRK